MNRNIFRLTSFLLILGLVGPVQAQDYKWYITPSIVFTDDDADRAIDDSFAGIQFSVGRHLTEHFTVEGSLGYSDIDGYYDDETHLDLSANVLAFYDRNRPFAAYAIAGLGYLGVDFANSGEENRPSATLGLGFLWKIRQSRYAIRGEYRARLAYESEFNFIDRIATLGVQIGFGARDGGPGAPNTNIDTDGDGVLDIWDECPDTPPGVQVTSRGCELRNLDRDSDGDRVIDSIDQCPNTPAGVPVDPSGCSLDSDRDGVTTNMDRCPGTTPGDVVDTFGCSRDADRDGVLSPIDQCPDTRPGARVDGVGCEFGDVIDLPGVNFGAGSDRLLPGTEPLLEIAARTLNRYPELRVEVAGHTDSDGTDDANLGLSQRRASTVRDQLIRFGVNASRVTARGYGESQPLADNATVDGRAANRRVELRVISQ